MILTSQLTLMVWKLVVVGLTLIVILRGVLVNLRTITLTGSGLLHLLEVSLLTGPALLLDGLVAQVPLPR